MTNSSWTPSMAHHGQQSHQHTHPISSYHQFLQNPSQKHQTRTSAHKRTNQQSEMPSERKNNNRRNDNEHKHHRPVSHQQHYQAPAFAPSSTFAPGGATPASSPPRRTRDDSITQGSDSKQQKQTEHQQASHREADTAPPRSKARINAITVKLKNGKPVTTATCEDPMEAKIEERLLEPIIRDHQGFDPEKLKKGMIKEMTSMISQGDHHRSSHP